MLLKVPTDPTNLYMLSRLALLLGLVAFLAGLFFAAELLVRRLSNVASKYRGVWYSVCFGGMVALFIARGMEIAPGIIIDPRGATLALAFVFGGPVAGWVTVGTGILTRITIGGEGMVSGVGGLLCTGVVMQVLFPLNLFSRRPGLSKVGRLLLFGSLAGIIDALSLLLLLDHGLSWMAILENGFVTFLVQTLGTLGFGSILHLELRELNDWALHRSAIRSSIDGFVLVRPDGKIHRVNPAMKSLTGKRTTELRALHWDQLVQKPNFAEIQSQLKSVANPNPLSFETSWALPGLASMVLEGIVTRAPEEFGGFFAYFHDVTDSRYQQFQINQIYELVPDLICLVNDRNEFERQNPAWKAVLGYSQAEMLGKSIAEFIHPEDLVSTLSIAKTVRDDKKLEYFVNRYRCRDGGYRWLEWSATCLPGQSLRLGVARDITERKQIEAQLTRYQLLAESARDIILFIRPSDGRLVDANHAAVESYGYPKNELLQRTIYDLRVEERHIVESLMNRVSANGYQFDTVHRRKDGTQFQVEVSTRRGQIDGEDVLFSVIRDISIRSSEARFRALFESSRDGILLLSGSGEILECNSAFLLLTTKVRENVVRSSLAHHSPPVQSDGWESQLAAEEMLAEVMANGSHFTEWQLQRSDGALVSVEIALRSASIGGESMIHASFRDVSRWKQAQQDILAAKTQADAANRAKSAFLANMSHELRTPLNAILGFSQLLSREEVLPSKARQKIETIRRSGEHLLSMISEILELARIESGQLAVHATLTNLATELVEIALWFGERATSKGLGFQIDQSGLQQCWVMLDGSKWRQIIINLLDNAIKFTDSGNIRLVVATSELDSGRIQISGVVFDSGPGISEADQAHLFEPFFRGEVGLHRSGSTGLGLAISRQFARILGGDLTVLGQLGRGSQFSVHVFGERASAPSAVGLPEPGAAAFRLPELFTPCRVLVVDDEPHNRHLIRDILEPAGFEVLEVNNGRDAVQICSVTPPGLILMDLRMPVMAGLEAIRLIRAQGHRSIPIIAVTAAAFKEDRLDALNAGADDFICKPFAIEQLVDSIIRLVGLSLQPTSNARPQTVTATPPAAHEHVTARIPSELLEQLEEFSAQADYRAVLETIRQISGIEPDVRNHLTQLAERFDFDGISQWVAGTQADARSISRI